MESKKRIQYNEKRKAETRKKLMDGVRAIAKTKVKVTKNALSKRTGVSRRIIDNYPDVIRAIEKANNDLEMQPFEKVSIDERNIKSLEEARAMIIAFQSEYNELVNKCNEMQKMITQRDLEIAKLDSEVIELKGYLNEKK